jgi:hypothetical protein
VTGRFEGGWTAEFRIPFSSLRYTDPPVAGMERLVFRQLPARPALSHRVEPAAARAELLPSAS